MQQLMLKRIRKKADYPTRYNKKITSMMLNGMSFDLIMDSNDNYFFRGNNKIYQLVNKINDLYEKR